MERKSDEPQSVKINRRIQAYKNLFACEDGRIVLADLKNKFNAIRFPNMQDRNIDPYRTHLDLGKMHVYDYIVSQIDRELLQEKEK